MNSHCVILAIVGVTLLPQVLPAETPPSFPRVPPTPPEQASKTFHVQGGFRMDLLAAEPLVTDPVAIAYDEDGRAYVAEMNDYPYTDKARHKPNQENPTDRPIGKIRLLSDPDAAGRFRRATVFADNLSWPTGVACWKGGVFVAATPDLWYLKDTDGDGVADVRLRLFTGFRKLNVQAVINNQVWGLDHHIYGAGGTNGGHVVPADKADAKPIVLTRNDFRIDPVTNAFEAISGGARFGNCFDDWDNRFLCNIRNPAQHVVLDNRYLARNPLLPVRSPLADVAEYGDQLPVYPTSPPEAWRSLRARRWANDPSQAATPRSELVGAGVVTSSSGVTVYRGAAYPPEFRGQIFVAECANNLFYRLKVSPDGVTFKATRADDHVDFVTSTDNWFRPVNFINAPDGCLHVLDMYRETIEHPWSIPDDIHAALDLESGRDRGRIYRLTPSGFRPPPQPHLGTATIAELVATLENPNSWWRETAGRLLFERQDPSAVEPLRNHLRRSTNPLARLHALYALDGLAALSDDDLTRALSDASPGVREHAIKLSEARLGTSPVLLNKVLPLAEDPDIRVRFQTAFTLGQSSDARVPAALAAIARRDAGDPWIRTAIGSSAASTSHEILATLLSDSAFTANPAGAARLSPPKSDLARQLAQVVGARNKPPELSRVFAALSTSESNPTAVHHATLLGLGEGLKRARRTLRSAAADPASAKAVDYLLTSARQRALDAAASPEARVQAIELLSLDEFDQTGPTLTRLLDPHQPQEVQRAAVAALSAVNRPEVAAILIAPWRNYTPAVRADVIQAMLGYKNRLPVLLDAVAAGKIPVTQIPPSRRNLLLKNADPEIASRAAKVFTAPISPRAEVIARYTPALDLKGDAARGHVIYQAICTTCHRSGDTQNAEGNDVGPNLATVRGWDAQRLLVNILDPNREVAPNYVEYVLTLKNGETLTGLIADETATAITLRRASLPPLTILRQDILRMTSSGLSLMPENLEAGITPQQMADLIAYLTRQP